MTTPFDRETAFYAAVEESRPSLFVFGREGEQWTEVTLKFFSQNDVPITFVPWDEAAPLRLTFELTRYPSVQLWQRGKLLTEQVGYHRDKLQSLCNAYIRSKRGHHV